MLVLMPILCFELGNWQYRRLHWKTDLIHKLQDRLADKATDVQKVVIPADGEELAEFDDSLEFTKFKLEGKFVHQEELFVGPRLFNDIRGYYVYTPFVITSDGPNKGKKVIVSRGFISEEFVDPQKRLTSKLHAKSLPMGTVLIECCLRKKVRPGKLSLDNSKEIRLLVYPDIYDMAQRSNALPVYFQQLEDYSNHGEADDKPAGSWLPWKSEPEGPHYDFTMKQFLRLGVPLGTDPDISIRNNHLDYMVTWYSLSLISALLLVYVLRKKNVNPMKSKLRHAERYQ